MPSHDELVKANAAIRAVLKAGIGARLLAIPGVHHDRPDRIRSKINPNDKVIFHTNPLR